MSGLRSLLRPGQPCEDALPLHFHAKHVLTYKEMLHMLRASSLVAMAPDPYLLLAAVDAWALRNRFGDQETVREVQLRKCGSPLWWWPAAPCMPPSWKAS